MIEESNEKYASIDEIRSSVINVKVLNQNKVVKRLNEWHITESFVNTEKEFAHYLINGHYSIKKDQFKRNVLPRLLNSDSNHNEKQSSGLLLLEKILFDEWKLQKAKLTLIAIESSLIPQLIKLFENNNDPEVQQSIYRLYFLLFFVIAKDNKKVRKSILKCDDLLTSIIRNLNQTNDLSLTKDTLLLLQFFPIWSKKFETISPMLSSIIKFIKHSDKRIVSQSCHTLLIFSQNCGNARKAISESLIINKLIDLLLNNSDTDHDNNEEDVVKPIIGVMIALLPLTNKYKDQFLNANVLSIIPKYVKSSLCKKIYACELIKNICMNPICEQLDKPTKQIQKVIDSKSFLLINDLLQNDDSIDVKSSALNAIFVTANKATNDQLKQLVEQGCLKSVCSQLESTDYKYLERILITIVVFLFNEYKHTLSETKVFPEPNKSLTEFANIISESDGIRKLKQIVKREKVIFKNDPKNRVSESIRIIAENILIDGFGSETRPVNQINETTCGSVATDCVSCKKSKANTELFPCGHVLHCHGCALKILLKIYSSDEPNKCPEEKCDSVLPLNDCPWTFFKNRIPKQYKAIEDKVLYDSVKEKKH